MLLSGLPCACQAHGQQSAMLVGFFEGGCAQQASIRRQQPAIALCPGHTVCPTRLPAQLAHSWDTSNLSEAMRSLALPQLHKETQAETDWEHPCHSKDRLPCSSSLREDAGCGSVAKKEALRAS